MNGDETGPDDSTGAHRAGPDPGAEDTTGALPAGRAPGRPSPADPTGPAPGGDSSEAIPFGDATEAIPAQAYGWTLGNRYRIVDRLGAGGMAEVFRAHDELLSRDVAVKVFRSVPAVPDTAMRKERQHAELRALAQLNHPNLITLYDGTLTERPAYLIIELIDGRSLAHRIEEGPLPEPEVRDIGRQVADALAYVHDKGMVHRDVKPANILLGTDATSEDSTTRVRLSDFGIVRLLGSESMTSVGSTLGTASYLAPEQTRGSSVGPPADIYALGLTLIEALSGERSFDGPPLEAAMARLHRDPVIPAHVAGPWPQLLAAMTAREPQARPTAGQVSRALRSTSADAPTGLMTTLPPDEGSTAFLPAAATGFAAAPPPVRPPMPPPPLYPPEPPPEERKRGIGGWLIAAAIVLAALAVGAILLFVPSSSHDNGGPTISTSTSPSSRSSSRSTARQAPVITDTGGPGTRDNRPSSDVQSQPSTEPPPSSASTSQSSSNSASSSSSSSASSSTSANVPSGKKTKSKKPKAARPGPARDARGAGGGRDAGG